MTTMRVHPTDLPGTPRWRPGSRCDGGARVEAASWRKSSRSAGAAECVEAGHGGGIVAVRDSALPGSPVIGYTAAAWTAFTARVKDSP